MKTRILLFAVCLLATFGAAFLLAKSGATVSFSEQDRDRIDDLKNEFRRIRNELMTLNSNIAGLQEKLDSTRKGVDSLSISMRETASKIESSVEKIEDSFSMFGGRRK